MMTDAQPSLFSRNDTFLGICEAIGEDFGFNPLFLRLALGLLLLWNPAIVIGTYLGMGVVILLSRLIFPGRRRARAEPRLETADGDHHEPLALAA